MNHIFAARRELQETLEKAVATYAKAAAETPVLAAQLAAAMCFEFARHAEDEEMRAQWAA